MNILEQDLFKLALTSLLAGIVSVVTSLITARKEIRKMPYEIRKTYADNLQKKRMEVYPNYFILISDLIKKADYKTMEKSYLIEWVEKCKKADSEISLFLSGSSVNCANLFLWKLEKLVQEYFENTSVVGEDFYEKFYQLKAADLEVSLKKDIGVYTVEFDPELENGVTEYDSIDKLKKIMYNDKFHLNK